MPINALSLQKTKHSLSHTGSESEAAAAIATLSKRRAINLYFLSSRKSSSVTIGGHLTETNRLQLPGDWNESQGLYLYKPRVDEAAHAKGSLETTPLALNPGQRRI
jgi:hypothetical protein